MPFGLTGQGKAGSITPLAITSIQPAGGSPAGGEVVDIYGRGFELGMTAKIDGVLCTGLVVQSANQLTCTTPAGSGTCDVRLDRVTTAANATLAGGYTYDFTPIDLSPVVWYRADTGVTLSGSDVTGWADQSGNADAARNLTNSGLGITRNATNAAFNNQATISFAGGVEYLLSGTWSVSLGVGTFTTIVIAKPGSTASNRAPFDRNNGASENTPYATVTTAEIVTFSPIISSGVTWSAAEAVINQWAGSGSADSSSIWVSSSTAAGTSAGKVTDVMNSIVVGAATGGAFAFGGDVAEVIVVSGTLTAGQLASVVAYSAARYGT